MKPERGCGAREAAGNGGGQTRGLGWVGEPGPGNGRSEWEARNPGSEVGRPAEGSSRGWKVGSMGEGRERGLGNGVQGPAPGLGKAQVGRGSRLEPRGGAVDRRHPCRPAALPPGAAPSHSRSSRGDRNNSTGGGESNSGPGAGMTPPPRGAAGPAPAPPPSAFESGHPPPPLPPAAASCTNPLGPSCKSNAPSRPHATCAAANGYAVPPRPASPRARGAAERRRSNAAGSARAPAPRQFWKLWITSVTGSHPARRAARKQQTNACGRRGAGTGTASGGGHPAPRALCGAPAWGRGRATPARTRSVWDR